MKLGETRSFWSLQGLSNAVENGGHLGSTADERLASLNLVNVSPKEGVGGSIPSGAARGWVAKLSRIGVIVNLPDSA